MRVMLRAKIHNARVTGRKLDYEGSITIDENLAKLVDLLPGEKVLVVDVDNGERFETYVIYGKKGEVVVNGAAAHRVRVGDRVIIMAFGIYPENEIPEPKIVRLDEKNNPIE